MNEIREDAPPRSYVKEAVGEMGLTRADVVNPNLIPRKAKRVGGSVFKPVVFEDGSGKKLHRLSQREAKFIEKFERTQNLRLACEEIGVTLEAGQKYFDKPHIKRFCADRWKERALAEGVTLDFFLAKVKLLVDGEIEMSKSQIEGMKIGARLVSPSTPIIANQTNIQNNFNGAPSPYANLSKEEMVEQMKKNVAELE